MNGDLRRTDEMLHDMFERRARRSTAHDMRDPILATTRATRQWSTRLRLLGGGRVPMRLLAVAALLLTTGSGLVAVASRPQQPPLPTAHVPTFVRPFDYAEVPNTGLQPPIRDSGLVAFATSGDDAYPTTDDGTMLRGAHGITISSTRMATTHPCPIVDGGASRLAVRPDPEGFLEDLRSIAGAGIGEASAITFDGRAAIAAAVDPTAHRCDAADFHVQGSNLGRAGYVELRVPSRLVLTEVDGMTIVLQAWAGTPEELEAWMPKAAEFLDHVHFTGP